MGRPAKTKASAAKAKAKASAVPARTQSAQTRTLQKLRGNYTDLDAYQKNSQLFPATGRTLKDQLIHDITSKDEGKLDVTFGKLYHAEMKQRYAKTTCFFVPSHPRLTANQR